jgi:hypothetical protein
VTFSHNNELGSATVLNYGGMSGIGSKFQPLLTIISLNKVNVVWSPVHGDAYEVSEALAIRHAHATAQIDVARLLSCFWNMGESSVIVSSFSNTGGDASDTHPITLSVW